MKPRKKNVTKRLGSALIMTLVIVVLITVVTVGYLASVMLESKTAGSSLDQERAYGVAMIGVHEAMSRVRDALGPWDDPFKNFATNAPEFYWSLSPGRITRWSYSSASPQTNFALFSESPGVSLVNLNRPLADGSRPIIGGPNPPDLSVKWANVLSDPSKPAGATNAIIGRYAFWVDDEGAKINVNTADGTEKYTINSLGIGSPSEVSMEVLFGGGNAKDLSKEIVGIARTNGFSSPREILRSTNVPADAYTNNVFALTAYSRSPELNIFGQPRMALTPILGAPEEHSTNMVINGITLRPVQEIYPTPSQLPLYKVVNPVSSFQDDRPWPLAFRSEQGTLTLGRGNDFSQGSWFYTFPNYCYINGILLANYLAGTNSAGKPVSWPVFSGSSSAGFSGKYSPRQLDNIVAQIVSLGSKAISADYPYPLSTDYPGVKVTPPSEDGKINGGGGVLEQRGCRYNVSPFIFPGWLSKQWVIGMGRAPKVNRLLLEVTTFGSQGTVGSPGYVEPKAQMDVWVECWLPAAYMGGKEVIPPQGARRSFGTRFNGGALNCSDLERSDGGPFPFKAAVLKKPDGSNSFWANQILTNDQGMDFQGNPKTHDDPDQGLAALYHDPYALSSGKYQGTAGLANDVASPLLMSYLQLDVPGQEWYPGEIRCIRSRFGSAYSLSMRTAADGSNLHIGGGIAVRSQIFSGWFSDPDPVPLESIRGENDAVELKSEETLTGEAWSSPSGPGGPAGTLRERHMASVIPVNIDIPVPPSGGLTGATVSYFAWTDDPLVNKFPGDWKHSNAPSGTMQSGAATPAKFSSYPETAFRATLADPDSYWMPQADCAISTKAELASQTMIPRSARMPNIGYLQYIRTGIIPDDENRPYDQQKGTPFRLLSFAPSTDSANQRTTVAGSQSYPDWAMLDLLYVPSTLTPFGSAYQAAANLAYNGTYGGATSGRINPNGAVVYTTDVNNPQPGISRSLPLEAAFHGIKVNQTLNGVGTAAAFTGGADVPATSVAQAVEDYVRRNGPLHLPAEICNIPEISSLRAPNNATRNDLVRQVVGNFTTQGNVFSVWAVGQAVQKKQSNADYAQFQTGDNVLAESRLHFIVERYLDPGADGVYGNSGNAGEDGVVGSLDDPGVREDPGNGVNHPFEPRYLYRVVSSEEIR